MKNQPHNVKTIKSENRALVLNYIRRGPISRSEISKCSNMSKSAVTMIINDLIREGQITEIGETSSAHGRRMIMLDIVPNYRYAAGIALHRQYVYVCLTDLRSNIVAYANHNIAQWQDPYALLDAAYREIRDFLRQGGIPEEKCIGIGVSAPGPVDYVTGVILNPPNFPLFQQIGVGEYLHRQSGLPVMVDNDAALLAMQYDLNRGAPRFRNYLFVLVSSGIGSAILNGGKIFRGAGGFAGELGHTSVHPDGLPCSCGNRGCLEQYISFPALRARFGFDSYEKLVDDAAMGDPDSRAALEYIADELSCAVANAVNLLDLDAVVIDGQLSYRPALLETLLQARVNSRSVITRTHPVEISFTRMPPDAARASACVALLNRYFSQKL